MSENTLYYVFSTIPQVIAAVAAIIAALAVLRISELRELLVGDGQAALNIWGTPGYRFESAEEQKLQELRLRGGIARKCAYEIEDVLKRLYEIEQATVRSPNRTGLHHVYKNRFCGTRHQIESLRTWTKWAMVSAMVTVTLSVISLGMVDCITTIQCADQNLILVDTVLFVLSLLLSCRVGYLCLVPESRHETEHRAALYGG